jgi:hypothetical protein
MYERLRASDRAHPSFAAAVHITDAPIELREGILRCLLIALELVFQLTNPSSLLRVLRAPPCALCLPLIDRSHLASGKTTHCPQTFAS